MPLGFGFGFGFGLASLLMLPLRKKIAISLETGVQNIGLIIALIKLTFKEEQHDEALRFPMFVAFSYVFWIFGFVVMARYGLTKPPEKDIESDMEMIKIPPGRQEGETGTPMGEQLPMNEDSFDENLFNFKQGNSCEDDSVAGGHYYVGDSDPWTNVIYTGADGCVTVDYGSTPADADGRVLVLHNYDGGRMTCVIISKTAVSTSFYSISDLGVYPTNTGGGYAASATISFVDSVVKIAYTELSGDTQCTGTTGDSANSCGTPGTIDEVLLK